MRSDISVSKVRGCLLGGAIGDALGLPMEGLRPEVIARRFPSLDRYHLLGRAGFVSDDTEQSALLVQALIEGTTDDDVVRAFRRHLRWWFARLPFGVGLATLRACCRLWLGFTNSGVSSGGNGAAMRAGVLGLAISERAHRIALGRRLAAITHVHPLAVEGALYVAELAALCGSSSGRESRADLIQQASQVFTEPLLQMAVKAALLTPKEPEAAASLLGSTGFIVHTIGLTSWAFLHGTGYLDTIQLAIRAGGDTDTHASIVGSWAGALLGDAALPAMLVDRLARGPFGAKHLTALSEALTTERPTPRWSALVAFARNLALYPVVLAHGFRRLIPFG